MTSSQSSLSSNTSPRLGFIGIGLMGEPMTQRLLDAGFKVHVWNRSRWKTRNVEASGAIVETSIAELVGNVDILMLCLANTGVVEEIVFGENGIAACGAASQRLIDFSSTDPQATREFANRLKKQCGMPWIDSPVSGGVMGAKDGSLAALCGGDPADIHLIHPLLESLAAQITHMGPVGSGQVTKVCNQMIVGCNAMVIAEMTALAEASGVDSRRLPQALQGGFADSKPFQILTPRMAARDFDNPAWHLRTLLKDLDMAQAQSQRVISATPMSALAAQLMRTHAARGYGEMDPATLIMSYSAEDPSSEME